MAKFKFHCRSCQQKILTEESAIGTAARCPNCGAAITASRDPDDPAWTQAERCLERYRILGSLPPCDISKRYTALDPVQQTRVMLYELPAELVKNRAEMDFVQSSARKMRFLQHSNVAQILDLQKDRTSGKFYLVNEYVSGVPLAFWSRLHWEAGIMNIPCSPCAGSWPTCWTMPTGPASCTGGLYGFYIEKSLTLTEIAT